MKAEKNKKQNNLKIIPWYLDPGVILFAIIGVSLVIYIAVKSNISDAMFLVFFVAAILCGMYGAPIIVVSILIKLGIVDIEMDKKELTSGILTMLIAVVLCIFGLSTYATYGVIILVLPYTIAKFLL